MKIKTTIRITVISVEIRWEDNGSFFDLWFFV